MARISIPHNYLESTKKISLNWLFYLKATFPTLLFPDGYILLSKSMDQFLCDRDLRHECVKTVHFRSEEVILERTFGWNIHAEMLWNLRVIVSNISLLAPSQRCTQNRVKQCFAKVIFAEHSILDVWQGSEYTSVINLLDLQVTTLASTNSCMVSLKNSHYASLLQSSFKNIGKH